MVWPCSSSALGLEEGKEEMNFVKITSHGATLTVPEFLVPSWPYDLPPDQWPTFCGAGQGWGDAIVPDTIQGVNIAPAGLCHDVEFSVSAKTVSAFMGANGRFFLNIVNLILASNLETWKMIKALMKAGILYLSAVSTMGVLFFNWFAGDKKEDLNPFANPTVMDRLQRLKEARDKYRDRPDERHYQGEYFPNVQDEA